MKRTLTILAVLLAFILFILSTGCGKKEGGGSSPSPSPTASPAQKVYENKEIGYTVTVPEGWKKPSDVVVGEMYVEYEESTFEPRPVFNIISTRVEKYNVQDLENQKEIKDELGKEMNVASERNTTVAGQPAYQIIYGVEKDGESIMVCQTYLFNRKYLMVLTGGCREDKFTNILPDFEKLISSLELKEPEKEK